MLPQYTQLCINTQGWGGFGRDGADDDWGCGWGQDVWGGAGVGPRTYVQGMGG